MSENAIKTAKHEQHLAKAVRNFVEKMFPGIEVGSVELLPPSGEPSLPASPKAAIKPVRGPEEVARELVETLYPEWQGDFSASVNHRRSIATLIIQKWAIKLVEEFLDQGRGVTDLIEKKQALIELARDGLKVADMQIADLQSELRQARELRGTYTDKAVTELQTKVANAERIHLTDQQLLATAIRERDEARNELVGVKAMAARLDGKLALLMTAVSANAEAPKAADGYLAAAVEKCGEFWGENARRSPTAQLVLADIIKARAALQPLTLINVKPEQAKTA